MLPSPVALALTISGLSLLYSTIALLIVLLRRAPAPHKPVEGIDGLNNALDSAGRDLPTSELPRPNAGTIYASSHGRQGQSGRVEDLGRTRVDWLNTKACDLP